MNLPSCLLICFALVSDPNSQIIENSIAPDGRFNVIVESRSDASYAPGMQGIFYRVETKSGTPASEELPSDFGTLRPLNGARGGTSVFWRSDDAYVVITTGHDRHHVDFIILAHSGKEFMVLPFAWDKWIEFSHRKALGFGYPSFIRWLPGNRIEVALSEYDGRNICRDSAFVLDLTDHLQPISWKVLQPEHKPD